MTEIIFPDSIFGKEVQGAIDRVLSTQQTQPQPTIQTASFDIKDPKNYIQVGIKGLYGNSALISKFELQGYNNLTWEKEHFKLHENGLYMSTPSIFMKHFNNVVDAFNNNNTLYYADSSQVSKEDVKDIYLHLTKNHISVYGSNPGAWTWLNSKAVKENNEWFLEIVIGVTNKKLQVKRENLESCLIKDSYIDFRDLNSQGLAKTEKGKSYVQGSNIYYFCPRNGCVARFDASSGGACLNFSRDPGCSDGALGVFACAEGTG